MSAPRISSPPWRTAFVCALASYLDSAALSGTATAARTYANSLHLTAHFIGLLLACQQFAFALGSVFGGRLADRLGRRPILTYALVIFAIGMTLLAVSNAPSMLVLGGVVSGFGIGADLPAALAMAYECAPSGKKGRMVALSQVLWVAGGLSVAGASVLMVLIGNPGTLGARVLLLWVVLAALIVLALRSLLPESSNGSRPCRQPLSGIPFSQAMRFGSNDLARYFEGH